MFCLYKLPALTQSNCSPSGYEGTKRKHWFLTSTGEQYKVISDFEGRKRAIVNQATATKSDEVQQWNSRVNLQKTRFPHQEVHPVLAQPFLFISKSTNQQILQITTREAGTELHNGEKRYGQASIKIKIIFKKV